MTDDLSKETLAATLQKALQEANLSREATPNVDPHPVLELLRLFVADRENSPRIEVVSLPLTLTPTLLVDTLARLGPSASLAFASLGWSSMLGSEDFTNLFDPVCKYSEVLSGHMGTVYGCHVYTDAFQSPESGYRFLCKDALYVFTLKENRIDRAVRLTLR